jgi:hypothetical protein
MALMKLRAAQIILWLYLAIVAASLLAASALWIEGWMPMDHDGQDVTDEATALWILEQGE